MTTTTVSPPAADTTVTLVQAPDLPPVDHVRLHGPRCFWDVRECRWECRQDR